MTASFPSRFFETPEAGAAESDRVKERDDVIAARGGCDEAFRRLVERHQQRVYQFCFQYLRDSEDAREVCQDVFIRAHRALHDYRPRARFISWLLKIALNGCHDRSRRRRGKSTGLRDDLRCGRVTPDEAAARESDLEMLERGLAALPEKSREVLVMSCLDGMSHAGCAAVLGCSERAVEGRLHRARRRLAGWWEKESD